MDVSLTKRVNEYFSKHKGLVMGTANFIHGCSHAIPTLMAGMYYFVGHNSDSEVAKYIDKIADNPISHLVFLGVSAYVLVYIRTEIKHHKKLHKEIEEKNNKINALEKQLLNYQPREETTKVV